MNMTRTHQAHPRSYAVDLARGFCLVVMTVDHVPRNILWRFSNVRFGLFGFFTGASGFVFLSGLVSAWVYGSVLRQAGPAAAWRRTIRRAGELYAVNLVLFLLLLGGVSLHLLSGSAWYSEFQPLFTDPWGALCRGVFLLYRPGYLDILPMYVFFLLAVTPALAGIQAGYGSGVMGLSILVWLWVQIAPAPESNALNPLGYQVLFVSGLIVGSLQDLETRLRSPRVQAVAFASFALAATLFVFRVVLGLLDSDPPLPYWTWLTHLESNGPIRLANFILFLLAAVWVWQRTPMSLKQGAVSRWLAHLGQHSLQVFAWSIAATYVSLMLMPPSPNRPWRLLDTILTVLSLLVPAQLHGFVRKRAKGAYGERTAALEGA